MRHVDRDRLVRRSYATARRSCGIRSDYENPCTSALGSSWVWPKRRPSLTRLIPSGGFRCVACPSPLSVFGSTELRSCAIRGSISKVPQALCTSRTAFKDIMAGSHPFLQRTVKCRSDLRHAADDRRAPRGIRTRIRDERLEISRPAVRETCSRFPADLRIETFRVLVRNEMDQFKNTVHPLLRSGKCTAGTEESL